MNEKVHSAGSLISAMGGTRGLLDSTAPALVFVVLFGITQDVTKAGLAAVAISVILGIVRLIARDTVQHAISGVVGVVICYLFARQTGRAEAFFLPSLIKNSVYALAYAISNFVRWPIFGIVIGVVEGQGSAWRKDSQKVKVYTRIGWIWVAMFLIRLAVQVPLYLTENVKALGIANIFLGLPLFFLVGYLSWLVLKSGSTKNVSDS